MRGALRVAAIDSQDCASARSLDPRGRLQILIIFADFQLVTAQPWDRPHSRSLVAAHKKAAPPASPRTHRGVILAW
jgi:hypothetical protein